MLIGNRTVTRRRYAAGSYSATGDWTPGATTDTTDTRATWRPIRPDEMERLEEGYRSRDPHVITTSLDYRAAAADEAAGSSPIHADEVVVDSVVYTVVAVHRNQSGIISHYKVICVRNREPEA